MSVTVSVATRLASVNTPLKTSVRNISVTVSNTAASNMGRRGAWQMGRGNPERSLRVREFDRGRSSLGQKHKDHRTRGVNPQEFKHDPAFHKVATFEGMIHSLSLKGFRRPYAAYSPPNNLDDIFVQTVARVVPDLVGPNADMSRVRLEGDTKARVLNALSKAVGGHDVPNSIVHTIDSLDKALTFYSTPVDSQTSYERMASAQSRGELPPNLHIQLDPLRFNPEQALAEGRTSNLNTITAYPRDSTILSTPEARKRYGKMSYKSKHSPYVNVPESNRDTKWDD